jgi:hypothetical protein
MTLARRSGQGNHLLAWASRRAAAWMEVPLQSVVFLVWDQLAGTLGSVTGGV